MDEFKDLPPEITELLTKWAEQTVKLMNRNLRDRKISTSGNLAKSIKAQVIGAANAEAQGVRIEFLRHGSFIELSRREGGKLPRVSGFTKWLAKKDITITKVPGYKNTPVDLTSERILQRVAWAMAVQRSKSDQLRPRPWYSALVYQRMNGVIGDIIDTYTDSIPRIALRDL